MEVKTEEVIPKRYKTIHTIGDTEEELDGLEKTVVQFGKIETKIRNEHGYEYTLDLQVSNDKE
jgi:hypothetical protein